MEFLKSVFPTTQNPQTTPPPQPSLFQTISNNYFFKDLQEFTSTLKQETSFIVHDLPARLDSGTSIALVSLQVVGDVIDNVTSSFSKLVNNNNYNNTKDSNFIKISNVRTYSRVDEIVRGLQCDVKTYCDEIDESGCEIGFRIEDKREEIAKLLGENGVIGEIFSEVVPDVVDETTFWCRYFYRVGKVIEKKEVRLRVVRRASVEEEEELSWDFDEDDESDNGKGDVGVSGELKAGSEGRIESDFSIISSQRSSRVGEDLGWDEIEDIGSGYESKGVEHGIQDKEGGLPKQLSDEEELTWDVEDKDQPIEK